MSQAWSRQHHSCYLNEYLEFKKSDLITARMKKRNPTVRFSSSHIKRMMQVDEDREDGLCRTLYGGQGNRAVQHYPRAEGRELRSREGQKP